MKGQTGKCSWQITIFKDSDVYYTVFPGWNPGHTKAHNDLSGFFNISGSGLDKIAFKSL